MFYTILKSSHSGLRWLLLVALIIAIVLLFRAAFRKGKRKPARALGLIAMILAHFQFLFGIILYFISPLVQFSAASMKDKVLRFYLVEHISLMLIAIVLITLGYSIGKKTPDPVAGFRKQFYYYLLGLLLIILSIPWPFRDLGAAWF